MASLVGIAGFHQHDNIAHRHQWRKKWHRLLGRLQLYYGYKSDRFMPRGEWRIEQTRKWRHGRIQSFQKQWRSNGRLPPVLRLWWHSPHEFFPLLDPFRSITIRRVFHRPSTTQTMVTRDGVTRFKNAFNHWSHEVEIERAQEVLPGKRGKWNLESLLACRDRKLKWKRKRS